MAPLIPPSDLSISSLELDARASSFDIPSYLESLTLAEREALNPTSSHISNIFKRSTDATEPFSPISLHNTLTARNPAPTRTTDPGAGSISPDAFNMKGIQALFALIGASMVLGAIWFFFWARNGGFKFQKDDWDDYKSTVLRRKGPDGKTLSNATKSTKLGGGSVYRDYYHDDERSVGMTELTKVTSNTTTFTGGPGKKIKKMRERMAEKKAKKSAASNLKNHVKEAERQQAKNRSGGNLTGDGQSRWEGATDNDVRAYRHERVARVGGLNRESDAHFYGSETDTTSNYTPAPPRHTHPPQTTSSPRPPRHSRSPEKQSHPNSARPSREYAHRSSPVQPSSRHQSRQSSPVKGEGAGAGARRSMPGSYVDGGSEYGGSAVSATDSQGTRSYHHPIPGLSGNKNGVGFRRGRADSLDD